MDVTGNVSIEPLCFYKWKINDFRSHLDKESGQFISSPNFGNNWRMLLYPSGYKGFDCVLGSLVNDSDSEVQASFEISVLDTNNKVAHISCYDNEQFRKSEKPNFYLVLDQNDIVRLSLLVRDSLTILVEMKWRGDGDSIPERREAVDRLKRLDRYESLLNSRKCSDVTFILGDDKTIPAHKSILIAQSSVFESMFSHDMKEKNENEIVVEDIEYDVFKELLRFVYAGIVENIKIHAQDLLIAADKYLLDDLKYECESVLSDTLTKETALSVFVTADACNCVDLKDQVVQFVSENRKGIIDSPKFNEFLALQSNLAAEMMCKLLL